jgi:hypothetical protein
MKFIFVKNAHNIYYKVTRPYNIRFLKVGISALLYGLSPPPAGF